MPGPLVTVAELEERPGFEDADPGRLEGPLDDASALVRDYVAPLLDDVAPPDTPPAVRAVVVNMVRRGTSNPQGHAQESLGDYSYATGGGGVATIYMTKREQKIVRKAVRKLGAGSIAMTGDLPVMRSEEDSR